jgi:hypothetical protein
MSVEINWLTSTQIKNGSERLDALASYEKWNGKLNEFGYLSLPVIYQLAELENSLANMANYLANRSIALSLKELLASIHMAEQNFKLIALNEEAALISRDLFGEPHAPQAGPVFVTLLSKAEKSQHQTQEAALALQALVDSLVLDFILQNLAELEEFNKEAEQKVAEQNNEIVVIDQTQTDLAAVETFGWQSSMAQSHRQNELQQQRIDSQEEMSTWQHRQAIIASLLARVKGTQDEAEILTSLAAPLTQGRQVRALDPSRAL